MTQPTHSPNPQPPRNLPTSWPIDLGYAAWKARAIRAALLSLLVVVAFVVGRCSISRDHGATPADASASTASPTDDIRYWTCSMHPQIKLPKFGQCPICFMDLIPIRAGAGEGDLPEIALSSHARVLAKVETSEVRRRELTYDVRMVGKVAVDETRITYISSYVPGRIDRLFVDYTGILVRKGDHLAEIYSPELLVAQREYLLAAAAADSAAARGPQDRISLETARSVLEAARRKLELWGIPRDEIERLGRERRPSDHMRIDSPVEGWVIERQGYRGMYVETGTRLFTVADLGRIWVMLDAYELDVPFLRYGQLVEFQTESHPGHNFTGQVAYIDPVLNEMTRSVKVRLIVPNEGLRLRPGMFVRARLRVSLGEGGQVVSDALAGRWLCPMHPNVTSDKPGACDECGMDLVSADSLGYLARGGKVKNVLAVPSTAVLLTGRRAVVYVESIRGSEYVYEGRVVELGPRAGDWYVVLDGLKEGERVVTRGALQIDSAVQIQARPSMMQPAESSDATAAMKPGESAAETQPAARVSLAKPGAAYHAQVRAALTAYLNLTAALAGDQLDAAKAAGAALHEASTKARPTDLTGDAAERFASAMKSLADGTHGSGSWTIDAARSTLPKLTAALDDYLRTFGHDRTTPMQYAFCPMALNNKGAYWYQAQPEIRNPYFGAAMPRCGEIKARIGPDGREAK